MTTLISWSIRFCSKLHLSFPYRVSLGLRILSRARKTQAEWRSGTVSLYYLSLRCYLYCLEQCNQGSSWNSKIDRYIPNNYAAKLNAIQCKSKTGFSCWCWRKHDNNFLKMMLVWQSSYYIFWVLPDSNLWRKIVFLQFKYIIYNFHSVDSISGLFGWTSSPNADHVPMTTTWLKYSLSALSNFQYRQNARKVNTRLVISDMLRKIQRMNCQKQLT